MRFWAAVVVVALPLMLGLIPGYWSIGPVAKAQFPFRFLAVAEFAFVFAATVFLAQRFTEVKRDWKWWAPSALIAAAAGLPLAYNVAAQLSAIPARSSAARATWEATYRDSDAYLPPAFFETRDAGLTYELDRDPNDGRLSAFATRGLAQLASRPEAWSEPPTARVDAQKMRGGLRLRVEAPEPSRIVVRRFYFPSWAAMDDSGNELKVESAAGGLVAFDVPRGTGSYVVFQRLPDVARVGFLISLLSCLALVAIASRERRSLKKSQ
jgi:hypothetical protein